MTASLKVVDLIPSLGGYVLSSKNALALFLEEKLLAKNGLVLAMSYAYGTGWLRG